MDNDLALKAIDFALARKWDEAVETNLKILDSSSEDTDALNRLARAYSELGEIGKARQTAEKVISIDPVNSIALKCLERWKTINKVKKDTSPISVDTFLEEPGRTKLVTLMNTGDKTVFANLDPGEEVKLATFAHRVSILTHDGRYIGRLPDDIAARLRQLIKSGNKYQSLIKSVEPKNVTVFIRELEKGDGDSKDVASFPPEKIDYVSFTPPELVHAEGPLEVGEDLEEAEGI